MRSRSEIIQAALALAETLPATTMTALAEALQAFDSSRIHAEINHRIPLPESRGQALSFIDQWLQASSELDSSEVAMAVEVASHLTRRHRDAQSIELVWTGPDVEAVPLRRTEQVILQLLDTAKERITMVSYAVYRIPYIAEAIMRAARRGVRLTVIVETPDKVIGKSEYSTLVALGDEVAGCSSIYYWPKEKRPLGPAGVPGLLHAKCVVADGTKAFLSSANLTEQAFSINLELGLLVSGGDVPRRVERVFQDLILASVLRPVE